ncbi:MAG: type VI secretion system membrane subunit TssM [Fibrobacter sp.]|nr:type VI secretion system membrane subunit TssM [Fibrobacter sp.]
MKLFNRKDKRSSKSAKLMGNNEVSSKILRELKTATHRYVDSVKRSNLFKNSAIYGNPWFMLIGPEKSGKTTVLNGSDVHFPLIYPEDKDGATASGVEWRFSNEAVWIDIPGKLLQPEGLETFRSVYQGLVECRNERPVDGIVCTISCEDLLKSDSETIKSIAANLRLKIDELIAFWGIELPVFCIITKADTISGFYEFFNDASVEWPDQLLGATFSTDQQMAPARKVFVQEHEELCGSLKVLRLKRLSKERKETVRRAICRFTIEFEGLQTRAGDFFAELFKDSKYEGKPVFRGFYFGSCKSFEVSSNTAIDYAAQSAGPSDLSNTVLNHPLNPHRMSRTSVTPVAINVAKKQVKSFFTKRLFSQIFPGGTQLLQKTQKFSRKERIRYWLLTGLFAVVFLSIGLYMVFANSQVNKLYNTTKAEMDAALSAPQSVTDAYEQLGRLGDLLEQYKKFYEKGMPPKYGIGLVKSKEIYAALKKVYINRLWNFIVVPTVSYLESNIHDANASFKPLNGEEYTQLYRQLKTYLSMSEAIAQNKDRIDTVTIRENIEAAIVYQFTKGSSAGRLPENVEIIVRNSIRLYCSYLKSNEMQLIQEKQDMVAIARQRLSKLPDAQVLYESMRDRLLSIAPQMTLTDLLAGNADPVLKSPSSISLLYTQEGWNRFVADELENVIKDPFKVDWVLGASKEKITDGLMNKSELREELIAEYYSDVFVKWIEFLGSISVEPFGDIIRAGTVLQKLAVTGSEMDLVLQKVLTMSNIEIKAKEEQVAEVAKKVFAKKIKKIEKKASPLKALMPPGTSPQEAVKNAFSPLSSFHKSEGSTATMAEYRNRMSTLAEALLRCSKQGNLLTTFNGTDQDPLLSSYNYTQKVLIGMPDQIKMALTPILLNSVDYTGNVMSALISKELNQKWQNDVAAVFTNGFAGKYPFSHNDDECSFDGVMEYFRPNTGSFWGFYTRNLQPYIYKDGNEWKTRQVGNITILFQPELFGSMKNAEKITRAFFNLDGTLIIHKIRMLPLPQNKLQGSITFGAQEYRILPDENSVRVQWPIPGQTDDVLLKIFVNSKYTEEMKFGGRWGLMRLFESARTNTMNTTAFVAKWERSVNNMFMIQYGCHVQIAHPDHPFAGKIFSRFDCPTDIIKPQQ